MPALVEWLTAMDAVPHELVNASPADLRDLKSESLTACFELVVQGYDRRRKHFRCVGLTKIWNLHFHPSRTNSFMKVEWLAELQRPWPKAKVG